MGGLTSLNRRSSLFTSDLSAIAFALGKIFQPAIQFEKKILLVPKLLKNGFSSAFANHAPTLNGSRS
jgi:hypothetical protein